MNRSLRQLLNLLLPQGLRTSAEVPWRCLATTDASLHPFRSQFVSAVILVLLYFATNETNRLGNNIKNA